MMQNGLWNCIVSIYIHWEGVRGKNSMEHLSGTYSCFMLFHEKTNIPIPIN